MATRDVSVNGSVLKIPVDWTVTESVAFIRDGFCLQGGFIADNGIALRGTDLIGSTSGPLTFSGGSKVVSHGGNDQKQAQEMLSEGVKTTYVKTLKDTPVLSPTNQGSELKMDKISQFLKIPLTFDPKMLDSTMKVDELDLQFCRVDKTDDPRVGVLPLVETYYYDHFARRCLSGTQSCSAAQGHKAHASSLYADAFGKRKSAIKLSSSCAPEFAMNVKDKTRIAENGEVKPVPPIAVEEMLHYTAIAMTSSFFPYSDLTHRLYYSSPPLGAALLGMGPMGMLFAVEWVGVPFYSIASQPFYAGSRKQAEAKKIFDEVERTRDYKNPLKVPLNLPVRSSPEKPGVTWGVLDNRFVKLIEATFLQRPQALKAAFVKSNASYQEVVGEGSCLDAKWSCNATFFYHLYKVMSLWSRLWKEEPLPEDIKYRGMFVDVSMFYGEFGVCLVSKIVGDDDAKNETMENEELMLLVVEAVLWLARRWGLLYIDIRPPNLRISKGNTGEDPKVFIIDYDDCVILKENSCCDCNTVRELLGNAHVAGKVFDKYEILANLFRDTVENRWCGNCANPHAKK